MRGLAAWGLVLLCSCGGAPGVGASGPRSSNGPADTPTLQSFPPEVQEAITVLQVAVEAMAADDMDVLRAHADPQIGAWFWDDPGDTPVPCTWLDPLGEEDPFGPDLQQCREQHLLTDVEPTLRAALDAWGVDRGPYAGSGAGWGSFDRRADLAGLRELADRAHATRSVRAAIDGQPIEHAFRAESGARSIVVYMTVREEAPYIVHVVARTRR